MCNLCGGVSFWRFIKRVEKNDEIKKLEVSIMLWPNGYVPWLVASKHLLKWGWNKLVCYFPRNLFNRRFYRRSTAVWIPPPWLNGNEIQQRPCSEMPTLMLITPVAEAPPCNTDGTQPPFALSNCSRSVESAFCRYFTHTTRLCSFLRQPWFLTSCFLHSCHFSLRFLPHPRCFHAISPFFFVRKSVIAR